MGNDCAGKFGKLKDPGLTRVVSAPNLGVTGLQGNIGLPKTESLGPQNQKDGQNTQRKAAAYSMQNIPTDSLTNNLNPPSLSGGLGGLTNNLNPSNLSGGLGSLTNNINPSSLANGIGSLAKNIDPSSLGGGLGNLTNNLNPASVAGNIGNLVADPKNITKLIPGNLNPTELLKNDQAKQLAGKAAKAAISKGCMMWNKHKEKKQAQAQAQAQQSPIPPPSQQQAPLVNPVNT